MRLAVISDIHGNLPALEAVLEEIRGEGIDAIVVVGDVVGGPFSPEVFDRLAELPSVRFVRGNGDRLAAEDEHERERLGETRVAAVWSWPLTVALDVDTLGRVLFCHAIPTDDEAIVTRVTPDSEVERTLGGTGADVVVLAHTHVQFDRLLESGLRVVNVGSVGMPYEGRRGAYWATLGPDVELRRTEYDVEAAAAVIRERAPNAADHALTLLEPPTADEATAVFESRRKAVDGA